MSSLPKIPLNPPRFTVRARQDGAVPSPFARSSRSVSLLVAVIVVVVVALAVAAGRDLRHCIRGRRSRLIAGTRSRHRARPAIAVARHGAGTMGERVGAEARGRIARAAA